MAKKQRSGGRFRGRQNNNGGGQGGGQGGGGYQGNRHRTGGGQGQGQGAVKTAAANGVGLNIQDQRREFDGPDGDYLPLTAGSGILEMHPNGYGFLRDPSTNFTRERTDPFVPGTMIEKFGLREGVLITGMVQHHRKQQGPRLREILDVDGMAPEDYVNVKSFDQLTPINPEEWLRLETGAAAAQHARDGSAHAARQGPTGADRRSAAHRQDDAAAAHQPGDLDRTIPKSTVIVLLIDERPEEVTDMRRNVNGEVFASSLDQDVESHVRLAQLDDRALPAARPKWARTSSC